MQKLQPGEYAPKSGDYKVMKNGKKQNSVHVSKGDKMPPTQTAGCHYELDN